MPRISHQAIGAALVGLCLTLAARGDSVWHVDADAPSSGNGVTWATAFDSLSAALAVATAGDEVRVAAGTYRPDPTGLADSRQATFQLISGVSLLGGYAGNGAADPDQRDTAQFASVLSGDLAGDDGPDFTNYSENVYHVLTGSGVDATAVLDGFTITGGNADGLAASADHRGGGLYNYTGSPTVRNCVFRANHAYGGGAIHNRESASPTIEDCLFEANLAEFDGGGIYNGYDSNAHITSCVFRRNEGSPGGGLFSYESVPQIVDCLFEENMAQPGSGRGGAIYARNNSDLTVTNCVFRANSGNGINGWGGAILFRDAVPSVDHCTFEANTASVYGGAVFHRNGGNATFTNCLFAGNEAASKGGALYTQTSDPMFLNCTFVGNSSPAGATLAAESDGAPSNVGFRNCILRNGGDEVANADASVITINHSDVDGGWTGPGTNNIDADPLFTAGPSGCYYLSQTAAGQSSQSPCVDAGDDTAVNVNLDDRTTRRDEATDSGTVDLGYHYAVTGVGYVAGDADADGDVDLLDLARFQACFEVATSPVDSGCCYFDLEPDADVDIADWAALETALDGPS